MRAVLVGTLLTASALVADGDCIEKPCQVATNVADRLAGEVDLRPNQFGLAGVVTHNIEFYPPEGFRTRVVRIHGDFTALFVGKGELEETMVVRFDPNIWAYKVSRRVYQAGVLVSFQNTGPEGSRHGFPLADNAMIYRQDTLDQSSTRIRFDYSEDIINGLLRPDNILRIVQSVFNNTSGRVIQMETTPQIQFIFEPIDNAD